MSILVSGINNLFMEEINEIANWTYHYQYKYEKYKVL